MSWRRNLTYVRAMAKPTGSKFWFTLSRVRKIEDEPESEVA